MASKRTKKGRRQSFQRQARDPYGFRFVRCLDCLERGCMADHAAEDAWAEHCEVYEVTF
jgi:hypothetical protein